MGIKGWKRSKHYSQPNTKLSWESIEGDGLEIVYNPTYSIPHRLILNGYKTIASANSFERIRKLAVNYMKKH